LVLWVKLLRVHLTGGLESLGKDENFLCTWHGGFCRFHPKHQSTKESEAVGLPR
jgi:hypothetical protein